MKDKVEISRVVFKIGGKKIELTLEEAKKLQELLNSNFGQVSIHYYPAYYPQPYVWNDWQLTYGRMDQAADSQTGGTLYCSCEGY